MTVARMMLILLGVVVLLTESTALAHHVLGRPAYIWNEDSRTPPAIMVETLIGQYSVNTMIYPAFPKAGEESRVKLYATHLVSHLPLAEPVRFFIRDDKWFGEVRREELGTQLPTDNIYRQIVVFNEEADYILSAEFTAHNEPYVIDLPIHIGEPNLLWQPLLALGVVIGVLGLVAIKKRRRLRN